MVTTPCWSHALACINDLIKQLLALVSGHGVMGDHFTHVLVYSHVVSGMVPYTNHKGWNKLDTTSLCVGLYSTM